MQLLFMERDSSTVTKPSFAPKRMIPSVAGDQSKRDHAITGISGKGKSVF
jgi:hypothetical protein